LESQPEVGFGGDTRSVKLQAREPKTNRNGETDMSRRAVLVPVIIIVNACIWGLAILMTAHTLRGTGAYQQIQHILGGCAGVSLVVVGGGLAAVVNMSKRNE
jgi:hypothetical protein